MLGFAFVNMMRLARRNCLTLGLSVLCIVSALVSFLFIQERAYYMYTVDAQQEQQTQVLAFTSQETSTIEEIYQHLMEDRELPEIGIVTVSDGAYAGLFWDLSSNDTPYYVPYGRFFSTGEMRTGENVVLLGTGFLCGASPEEIDAIWETGISIKGTRFRAIGNYLFTYPEMLWEQMYPVLAVPAPVTIPLKTYFSIGLPASQFRCVFTSGLTEEQCGILRELLNHYEDITVSLFPSAWSSNAARSYVEGIAPYALIFFLGFLCITNIMTYCVQRDMQRYRVYLICGARNAHIVFFLFLNVILLVTVSYVIAFLAMLGLTWITPDGILARVPWQFHAATYGAVTAVALIAVSARALPSVLGGKML